MSRKYFLFRAIETKVKNRDVGLASSFYEAFDGMPNEQIPTCTLGYELVKYADKVNRKLFQGFFNRNSDLQEKEIFGDIASIKITVNDGSNMIIRNIYGIDYLVKMYDGLDEKSRKNMHSIYQTKNSINDQAKYAHAVILDIIYRAICNKNDTKLNFLLFCISDQITRQGFGYALGETKQYVYSQELLAEKQTFVSNCSNILNQSAMLCKIVHCVSTAERLKVDLDPTSTSYAERKLQYDKTKRFLESMSLANMKNEGAGTVDKKSKSRPGTAGSKRQHGEAEGRPETAGFKRQHNENRTGESYGSSAAPQDTSMEPTDQFDIKTDIFMTSDEKVDYENAHTKAVKENDKNKPPEDDNVIDMSRMSRITVPKCIPNSVGCEPAMLNKDEITLAEIDAALDASQNEQAAEAIGHLGESYFTDQAEEARILFTLVTDRYKEYKKGIELLLDSVGDGYKSLVDELSIVECCYVRVGGGDLLLNDTITVENVHEYLIPELMYLMWIRDFLNSKASHIKQCTENLYKLFIAATQATGPKYSGLNHVSNNFTIAIAKPDEETIYVCQEHLRTCMTTLSKYCKTAKTSDQTNHDNIRMYIYGNVVEALSFINDKTHGVSYIWLQMRPYLINYQALGPEEDKTYVLTSLGFNISNPKSTSSLGALARGAAGGSRARSNPTSPHRSPIGETTTLCKGRKAQAVYIGERGRKYVRLSRKSLGTSTKGYEYMGLKDARTFFTVSATKSPESRSRSTQRSQSTSSRAVSPSPPRRATKASPASSAKKTASASLATSTSKNTPQSRAASPSPPKSKSKSTPQASVKQSRVASPSPPPSPPKERKQRASKK